MGVWKSVGFLDDSLEFYYGFSNIEYYIRIKFL